MLQLIESIVTNPEDKTQVTLLFANKSDYDIICKSKLDEFVAAHSDQLKVVYTVEEQKGR
jgi:cytochrome-b5 reductase